MLPDSELKNLGFSHSFLVRFAFDWLARQAYGRAEDFVVQVGATDSLQ